MTVCEGNEVTVSLIKRAELNRIVVNHFNRKIGAVRQAVDASNFGTVLTQEQAYIIAEILEETAFLLDEWKDTSIADDNLALLSDILINDPNSFIVLAAYVFLVLLGSKYFCNKF
jgi:hypothetical protein